MQRIEFVRNTGAERSHSSGWVTLNPRATHLAATASLDRTVKIWDLRTGDSAQPHMVAEHTSKLSVSSAVWNARGSIVTTSYDDTIKVYKQPESKNWPIFITLTANSFGSGAS